MGIGSALNVGRGKDVDEGKSEFEWRGIDRAEYRAFYVAFEWEILREYECFVIIRSRF